MNDWKETEELFRLDVLVTCPSFFNLSISFPAWTTTDGGDDRTFELVFDDGKRIHSVFLTYLHLEAAAIDYIRTGADPRQLEVKNACCLALTMCLVVSAVFAVIAYPINAALLKTNALRKMPVEMKNPKPNSPTDRSIITEEYRTTTMRDGIDSSTWNEYSIRSNSMNNRQSIFDVRQNDYESRARAVETEDLYYGQEDKTAPSADMEFPTWPTLLQTSGQQRTGDSEMKMAAQAGVNGNVGESVAKTDKYTREGSRYFRISFACYVVLRVGFAITFSLIVTSSAAIYYWKAAFDSEFSSAMRALYPSYTSRFYRISVRHIEDETSRQSTIFGQAQKACDDYTNELVEIVRRKTLTDLSRRTEPGQFSTLARNSNVTAQVVLLFVTEMSRFHNSAANFSLSYRQGTETAIRPWIRVSRSYLERIFDGSWFRFPRKLFNGTTLLNDGALATSVDRRDGSFVASASEMIDSSSLAFRFARFLRIAEVEEIQMWLQRFWQR